MNYHLYLLDAEFLKLFSKQELYDYNIKSKSSRPFLILDHNNEKYSDCYCVIPIGSEKKDGKYKIQATRYPEQVMELKVEGNRNSFLFIQNYFYLKKFFLAEEYLVNGEQFVIKNKEIQEEIKRRFEKFNKKIELQKKYGNQKTSFVPLDIVYKKQKR